MAKRSAGLLMYRNGSEGLEIFLVHPGGPFWAKKDLGAWTLPKGEYEDNEPPLSAAVREFTEETGFAAPSPEESVWIDLGTIKQAGGKIVSAWAFEGDCDPAELVSNHCTIEWPPRSGRRLEIPEADRGQWFSLPQARTHILQGQIPFLDRLEEKA
ncbi:NUDIX domain-containing protein [Edaphobacter sp. HDX4]|uniref:NUDIX domain-containing protein n=1 Tax=Edaphobacter sp. HDX4 TaxID=2794064 RepID=UPI002FE627D5